MRLSIENLENLQPNLLIFLVTPMQNVEIARKGTQTLEIYRNKPDFLVGSLLADHLAHTAEKHPS